MKTWIKGFFISIGLLAVLIISFAAGLHLYVKTDHAQELVLSKINANLPGMISWQDLSVSALTGYIEIQCGIIQGPKGEDLITFNKLSLDLSWLRLLWGELFIEEAVIDKPWVYLGLDSKNNLMLMRAFSDQKERSVPKDQIKQRRFPFNIVVDELVISGGSILFETADRSVLSNLSGIDITADADLFAQSVNLSLHMAQTRYKSDEIKTDLQKIFVQASLKKHRIDPIIIQAQTASSTMRVMGSMENIYENPFFDVSCDILVSLSELRDTLDLQQEFKGQVDARIKASGILDNPEVKAQLNYGGGLLAGKQVGSADLDIRLKDKVVTLENAHIAFASGDISLQGQADLTNAFPSGFFSGNRDIDAITYNFKTNAQGIEIAEFMPGGLIMGGTLNPVVSLAGTGISLDNLAAKVSAELDIKKLAIDDVLLPIDVSLKTQGSIQKRIIRVDILEARSGQSTLEANALVDLSSEKVDASIELSVPDLKQDLIPLGIHGKGRLGLTALISQTLAMPALVLTLNGEQVSLANISLGDFVCNADLDQSGNLKISRFVLQNQGSMINGSGSMKIFEEFPKFRLDAPVRVAATLTHVELQDFMNSQGLKGSFDGDLSLGGTLFSPEAKLFLAGRDVSIRGGRIGDIESSSHFEQGALEVDQIIVKNRNSRMNMSGAVKIIDMTTGRFYEDPPVRVNMVGNPVFLEDVIDKFKGRLTVNAGIEGSVRNPRGTLRLSGTEIDLGFEKIHEINISSRIEDKRLTVDGLDIILAENETITGTGWVSLEKEYTFDLTAEGISFNNIQVLENIPNIEGRIALDVSGQGTFENPGLHGEGTISDLVMKEKKLDDLSVNFDLHDHSARVTGDLDFAFEVSYHLETHDFMASAVFDNTDLSTYFQIARQTAMNGSVNGKIEASGNSKSIKQIRADMDLSHLDISFKGEEIVRADDIKASVTEGVISVPGAHIILGRHGWLDIEGTGALHGAVSLTAKGDIPLLVVEPFVEDLTNIEGHVLLSAQMGGTRSSPAIEVEINLEEIGFQTLFIEERLHSTSGRITINPQAVLIEKIAGKLGQGSFDLAGKVELKDLFPERVGFRLNARSLPVRIPDTLDLYADLEVLLEGTPDKSLMKGKAVLLEGVYYRDVKLSLVKGLRSFI